MPDFTELTQLLCFPLWPRGLHYKMTVQDKGVISTLKIQERYLVYLEIRSKTMASPNLVSNHIRIMYWGSFKSEIMLCQWHLVFFRGSLNPCALAHKTADQVDLRDLYVIIYKIFKTLSFLLLPKRTPNGPFLPCESHHPTLIWLTYIQ